MPTNSGSSAPSSSSNDSSFPGGVAGAVVAVAALSGPLVAFGYRLFRGSDDADKAADNTASENKTVNAQVANGDVEAQREGLPIHLPVRPIPSGTPMQPAMQAPSLSPKRR